MAKVDMGEDEKKWQAEQDVRTLVEAAKIKRDKPRHERAMKKLAEMKKDVETAQNDG